MWCKMVCISVRKPEVFLTVDHQVIGVFKPWFIFSVPSDIENG